MTVITSDELAADIVRFVFRSQLGRDPTPSDIIFQKTFLLDGRLSLEGFNAAIAGLEEARLAPKAGDAAGLEEVHELHECSFCIPADSFLASVLRHRQGYEWWALPLFLDLCRPGATVVDVGANWGAYASRQHAESGRRGMCSPSKPMRRTPTSCYATPSATACWSNCSPLPYPIS